MPDKQQTLREQIEDILGIGSGHHPDELCCAKCDKRDLILEAFASHLEGLELPEKKSLGFDVTIPQGIENHGWNQAIDAVQSIIKEEVDSLTKNTNA